MCSQVILERSDGTGPLELLERKITSLAKLRALAMGIDRTTLLRSAYGPSGLVTSGPVAQAHWTHRLVPRGTGYDPAGAQFDIAQAHIANVREGYNESGWAQARWYDFKDTVGPDFWERP